MHALNPENSIPTIDIEGSVNVGFDPQWISSTRDTIARRRLALP